MPQTVTVRPPSPGLNTNPESSSRTKYNSQAGVDDWDNRIVNVLHPAFREADEKHKKVSRHLRRARREGGSEAVIKLASQVAIGKWWKLSKKVYKAERDLHSEDGDAHNLTQSYRNDFLDNYLDSFAASGVLTKDESIKAAAIALSYILDQNNNQ
ncbi:hypothetical protein DFJ74DRAFT_610039 [Hyaloraphidium curvatum]|uniref:Orf154 n=1 Tax=Hyaloraphidium curvatum TaxID=82268 RepID=Q950U3_HYACU|nr:orf154 [Hyaloraphidium curvatum]AAK83423.1 orf154 [Hyaloraphidium curvatum]KAI9013443.1 hypothetical protein DFJ74DRAFT_610039 [Hyaloraphidium curvatum]